MSQQRRLFFALWPDGCVRRQIKAAHYPHLKPATIPLENWHMTLVFLGLTSPGQQAKLESAADTVSANPFIVKLDTTGQFARAGVAWLGCRNPHPELLALQGALESVLRKDCPEHPAFDSKVQFFRPHLSLYRHISETHAPVQFEPIHWPVKRFCLIESRRDKRPVYQILNSWNCESSFFAPK